jgi:hypothetical protein
MTWHMRHYSKSYGTWKSHTHIKLKILGMTFIIIYDKLKWSYGVWNWNRERSMQIKPQ